MIESIHHIVDGSDYSDPSESLHQLRSPKEQEEYLEFPTASDSTIDAAIKSSSKKFEYWSALSLKERTDILLTAAQRARLHIESLAIQHSHETGKSIAASTAEISGAIQQFEKYAELAKTFFQPQKNLTGHTLFRPYGPTVLIVPWNYPIAIAFRTLPALLISGNTVIWKPSERTPGSAYWILKRMNLPSGLVNLVLGFGDTGAALVADSRTKLVIHTGSTQSGRSIAAKCGELLKPCILELGGKDSIILDTDIDLTEAAPKIARASLENSGQICTSIEKVFFPVILRDSLTDALVKEMQAWTLGEHDYELKTIGPMIDTKQVRIVENQVRQAVTLGAKCIFGGTVSGSLSNYFLPTILIDIPRDAEIHSEETFGPVVSLYPYSSHAELVELLNSDGYGLATTIMSNNPKFLKILEKIDTAIVWINEWHSSVDGSTFEPSGKSGLGKIGPGNSTLLAVNRAVQISGMNDDFRM